MQCGYRFGAVLRGAGSSGGDYCGETVAMSDARLTQVGGSHYVGMAIQPVEYIHRNSLGFIEGCVVKYVSRWRNKNGVEDLRKARHFIDLLIELEEGK